MYEYFTQPLPTRKAAIETAAIKMGVNPIMIEKDLWVAVVLQALFSNGMADAFILKGSASLSKAYAVTQRFSENLPINIERSFLGLFPSTRELIQLNWEDRIRQVDVINQQAQIYLRDQLVPLLKARIEETCKEGVEVYIPPNEPLTIEIYYPSFFRDKYLYTKPKVELNFEVGEEALFTKKAITTLLQKYIPTIAPVRADIKALSPHKTFYEEAMVLHMEAQRMPNAVTPIKMSCHYYDMYQLAAKGYLEEATAKINLLEEVFHNQMLLDKFVAAEYEFILTKGIKLLPPQERIPGLKTDYKRMEDLFFDYYPSMEEILGSLAEVERAINIALEGFIGL